MCRIFIAFVPTYRHTRHVYHSGVRLQQREQCLAQTQSACEVDKDCICRLLAEGHISSSTLVGEASIIYQSTAYKKG
jgi:hypothetical protein